MGDLLDPFAALAQTGAKVMTDAWTTAMLGLWNAGLWLLRLALTFVDFLLTPDLTETGPGAWLYQVMFWIAGALLLIMALIQLGVATGKRDGKGLARAAIGMGQFVVVWAGWIAYGVAIVAAAGGLTRALMEGLLNVTTWTSWQPFEPFTPADITDAGVATVLGLLGLLLWVAAIGQLLVMLVRSAALMVLLATTPIAAAGLVSEAGRSWFWKSLRWFHAAALSPVVMVLVLGVGVQFTTGVANGLTGVQGAIGTAVPGVLLICLASISPLALFKLLAFVDPGTTSGAALRASMVAVAGIQGLLGGRQHASNGNQATQTDEEGRTDGEDGADGTTSSRFASALTNGLGPVGHLAGQGIGLMARLGTAGAAVGADLTNQMGVGHNTYPPDFAHAGRRAQHRQEHRDRDEGTDTDQRRDNQPPGNQPHPRAANADGRSDANSFSMPSTSDQTGHPSAADRSDEPQRSSPPADPPEGSPPWLSSTPTTPRTESDGSSD